MIKKVSFDDRIGFKVIPINSITMYTTNNKYEPRFVEEEARMNTITK